MYAPNRKKQERLINREMVLTESLENAQEEAEVKALIASHIRWTGSPLAISILEKWESEKAHFIRVIPHEYKDMMKAISYFEEQGLHKLKQNTRHLQRKKFLLLKLYKKGE